MRVLAAADKMISMNVCDNLHKTCDDYWREKVEAGEMSQDKLDSLRTFFGSDWRLWDNQKVHYYKNPNDPNRHFVLGFTGRIGIMNRYTQTNKGQVEGMQDLANIMHYAHNGELKK